MKIAISIASAMLLLASCSIIHKTSDKRNDRSEVKSAIKTDSAGSKKVDSLSVVKEQLNKHTITTSTIDTGIVVGGDSLSGIGAIPDTGHSTLFTDGDISTEVGVDAFGKLHIKTRTKQKIIPVKQTIKTETFDNSVIDTKTSVVKTESAKVTSKAVIDSSRHTKETLRSKEVSSFGKWWLWVVIIIAALVFIAWKLKLF